MNLYRLKYLFFTFAILTASCSSNAPADEENADYTKPQQQSFTVVVESVGELFEGGEGVIPGIQVLWRRAVLSQASLLHRRSTSWLC